MKIKLTTLFIFGLLAIECFSQDKEVILQGTVISANEPVAYAHVYNTSKKKGTITSDDGTFELKVSAQDTLFISSLTFTNQTVILTDKNIEEKEVLITLFQSVQELEEIFLRGLTGSLNFDIANKPKDTIPEIGYKYKKEDLRKFVNLDQTVASNRPDPRAKTDPIGAGAGVGLPDKKYQRLLALKRELKQKKEFTEVIVRELGLTYFTETLKIPEEKISNFLSYCEYKNIVYKYHNNKQLEVITILKEESKNYNQIKQ